MTALNDFPTVLSNSFESLPQEIIETEKENRKSPLITPLLTDSSPVLIVTAGYDHTIRFWDVLQGICIATLQHNESVIYKTQKVYCSLLNAFGICSKLIV